MARAAQAEEDSITKQADTKLKFQVSAKEVYLVMGSDKPAEVRVSIDGEAINLNRGEDVGENGIVTVEEFKLYRLVSFDEFNKSFELELTFDEGVQVNAFTFGG